MGRCGPDEGSGNACAQCTQFRWFESVHPVRTAVPQVEPLTQLGPVIVSMTWRGMASDDPWLISW